MVIYQALFFKSLCHRTVEVGRDSGGHLVQFLLKQDHLQQGAHHHVLVAFDSLQGGHSATSLGTCASALSPAQYRCDS